MLEYYTKLISEHPLLTYIEDAFAQFDFAGHQAFNQMLTESHPGVKMGLRQVFTSGMLQRFKDVTSVLDLTPE